MKQNIIKTDNYLLIVSDEEMNDCWTFNLFRNQPYFLKGYYGKQPNAKKIIGHLPLNNLPILESVDLLPPLEDDENVEQIAEDDWDIYGEQYKNTPIWDYREIYVAGYNKAKEKYKYTEDDMIEYSNWLFKWCEYNKYRKLIYGVNPYGIGEFISDKDMFVKFLKEKSHQQPKYPVGFEYEMWYN